ncbi:MAG: peptidoglycan-binding protein [Treponema sp.]|nr:peptidoglycan-binding protein [Treponema sp.]
MNCDKIINMFYEDDEVPLVDQIRIGLHTIFCSSCADKIEQYYAVKTLMKDNILSFPRDFSESTWSDLEESIMQKLSLEQTDEEETELSSIPGALSTRRWIIAGLILMVSLVTVFFGLDFKNLANESGMSLLLPMGITIGIVLTTYGALFIGSHLKELSERFGL